MCRVAHPDQGVLGWPLCSSIAYVIHQFEATCETCLCVLGTALTDLNKRFKESEGQQDNSCHDRSPQVQQACC